MNWIIDIPLGAYAKVYVAEIIGEDPRYRFRRRFLKCRAHRYGAYMRYTCETGDSGVYESCVRYYDKETGELIRREREWFVMAEQTYYEIEYGEVLHTLFNLQAQGYVA